ncbi:MAG TPA: hypothetical protein VD993_07320 [Chitinophagaceae bacterium]|nr:hypothetical protein [Chitinophagaceae bacterium]
MKQLLTLILLFTAFTLHAQQPSASSGKSASDTQPGDFTGTWEGEFIFGTIGLRQPAKMVLEIVQVEGKMYCIVDLYPIDTKKTDIPNITYTFEGNAKPEKLIYSLIQGRVVEGGGTRVDVVQFLFEHKDADSAETLAGRWFRHLEPVSSRERGSGTFTVKRVTGKVSDRLKLPRQKKEILEKLDKQQIQAGK